MNEATEVFLRGIEKDGILYLNAENATFNEIEVVRNDERVGVYLKGGKGRIALGFKEFEEHPFKIPIMRDPRV